MSDVVAIEHVCVHGAMKQLALKRLRNGRFSSAGETGQPNHCSTMATPHRTLVSGNFALGPKNIFTLCNLSVGINAAENRAATADLPIVYDDKSPEIWNSVMIINDKWAASLNRQFANFISLQLFASVGFCLER